MSGCCFLLDLSFRTGIDWNQKQLWIYWNLQSKSTLELRADFNGPNGSKLKDERAHRLVHQTERQLSRSSDVLFTLRDDITPTVRPTLQSPRGWARGRVGPQPSHWHSGLPRVPKTGADSSLAWELDSSQMCSTMKTQLEEKPILCGYRTWRTTNSVALLAKLGGATVQCCVCVCEWGAPWTTVGASDEEGDVWEPGRWVGWLRIYTQKTHNFEKGTTTDLPPTASEDS